MSDAVSISEKSLAYRFFQDIALDLSRRELKFPTFLDAALRVRLVVSRHDAGSNEVAQAVRGEPLLSARVVSMANSVAVNPSNSRRDPSKWGLYVGSFRASIGPGRFFRWGCLVYRNPYVPRHGPLFQNSGG